jgi:4'-phosphopantetheinyl transferase EntD
MQHQISIPNQFLEVGMVATCLAIGPEYFLYQEEISQLNNRSNKRVAEFSAGRECARQSLREFGVINPVIPIKASREPHWPSEFIGSVSHSSSLSIAVVAKHSSFQSIGVDIESAIALERALRGVIEAHNDQDPLIANQNLADCLKYSCKEAAYKCWFTAGGNSIINFDEMTITFNESKFIAYGPTPMKKPIHGKWIHSQGYFWTLSWI